MTDILGPADADMAVTLRPADDRTFGVSDSWFKDCSTPTADDGTAYNAAFFNSLIANLRNVARVNSSTEADPTVKIVPENGGDDYLIVKALQHLMQRGQVSFGTDTGSVNALAVTLTPALIEYKAGLRLFVLVANTVTGASTIRVNGLPPKSIVRPDGSALRGNDAVAGEMAELVYDGARFQKVGLPTAMLSGSRTYYVDGANGSDANDGLAAGAGRAFATIQKAVNTALLFNLNGYGVTVRVADWIGNTYAPVSLQPINGSGTITIIGNVATPSNTEIHAAAGSAVTVFANGYTISGFKVSSAGRDGNGGGANGIWVTDAVFAVVDSIDWGSCPDFHMFSTGRLLLSGPQRISGPASCHIRLAGGGGFATGVGASKPSLTVAVAVTMSGAFVFANQVSICAIGYSAIAGGANVIGKKFDISANSIIDTTGAGESYLPGTVAGTKATGAQYL